MELRIIVLKAMLLFIFSLLAVRMGYLQLYQGRLYLKQADKNRIKVVEEDPVRGLIFDRKGRILVENRPSYTIVGNVRHLSKDSSSLILLNRLFKEDNNWGQALRKAQGRREIRLKRDVDFSMMAAVEERRLSLPGIEIKAESKRFYPMKTSPHLLGYLGEITSTELTTFKGFKAGDIVGKQGVEKACNDLLWGIRGYRFEEVDAHGSKVRRIAGMKCVEPANGADIYLTIDLNLQLLAEELLRDKSGAIIALDPNNGDVLAMASAPAYDPEIFAGVLNADDWNALLTDPDKPLLDRALQGTYPPGSVLKMAVLAAGLEEEVIPPEILVNCPGFLQMGRRTFKCWREGGHGRMNAISAIEQSCDVYFYQLGLELGIDRMANYIRKFGFGKPTGIDIEGEVSGLVPDSVYMNQRYGEKKWTRGHLLNIAIGQGELLVTPLQLAVFCAILANKGKIPKPHLLKGVLHHNPDFWVPAEIEIGRVEGISSATFDLLYHAMKLVVQGEKGTVQWLMDPALEVAGKTGTAQNPHGEDHAWFIGFAPFTSPTIAVCVLIEHGEHGSSAAAPIVFKLIRNYLNLEKDKVIPHYSTPIG